jgi:hypothetical protein
LGRRLRVPFVFIHGTATLGELRAADLADLAADFRFIAYNRRVHSRVGVDLRFV